MRGCGHLERTEIRAKIKEKSMFTLREYGGLGKIDLRARAQFQVVIIKNNQYRKSSQYTSLLSLGNICHRGFKS